MTIEWHHATDVIEPYVVRIATPRGSGTGFLLARGKKESFIAIATAAHVVQHAHFWEEPIRIDHLSTSTSILLRVSDRAIFIDEARDSAAIVFDKPEAPLPEKTLALAPEGKILKVGVEVGWLGYPAVSSQDLCFFS